MTTNELKERIATLELLYVDAIALLGDEDREELLALHASVGAPLTNDLQAELHLILECEAA